MINLPDLSEILAALGLTGWFGQFLWGSFLNRKKDEAQRDAITTEATAKTGIIEAFERRASLSDDRQAKLEARINDMEVRLSAEHSSTMSLREENSNLRIRIRQLEAALRQAGIPFPEEYSYVPAVNPTNANPNT